MSDSDEDLQDSKLCSKCEEEKPFCEFNADSRRKDGKRASCKACDAEQKRRIRGANLEEYRRRNAENNRNYRARKQGKNTSE
jgi:hypothetical protein